MLKLAGQLVFKKVIEMLELESSAFEEFVDVDILGHPCVRLQALHERIPSGINTIHVLPLLTHLLILGLLWRCLNWRPLGFLLAFALVSLGFVHLSI
jgi:hypothetical protein